MEQNTKGSTNNKDIQLDDILERINGIFGQYNSKRVTHKECLTHENFKTLNLLDILLPSIL